MAIAKSAEQKQYELNRYLMGITEAVAVASGCVRGCLRDGKGQLIRDDAGYPIGRDRVIGCVIFEDDRLVAAGFNAPCNGEADCAEVGCLRDEMQIPSGVQLEQCRALHAEQRAILSAVMRGKAIKGLTICINAEPCLICARLIAGSGIKDLVVKKGVYPNNGLEVIKAAGIEVRQI